MTNRWNDFKDRELRLLYQALLEREDRTSEKLLDEVMLEAENRGAYRAKHILVSEDDEPASATG